MRWLVRLSGVLIVLVVLAFGALALVPSERVAQLATDRFEAMTGRKLTIEGGVRPSLWPVLGVETGRVTLSNAAWSEGGPMLVAEAMTIRLDLAALTGGAVRITGFELLQPVMLFERSRDGRANWEFGDADRAGSDAAGSAVETETAGAEAAGSGAAGSGANTAAAPEVRPFSIDRFVINEGSLRYVDYGSGQDVRIDRLMAELKLPDHAGPLDFDLTAEAAGKPVSASGSVQDAVKAAAGGVVALRVAARIGAATLAFDGRGGLDPVAAEGQVEADLGDLSDLSAVLGTSPPDLPEGFGARSVTLSGKMTRSGEGDLYLRGATIGLDATKLTGDIDLLLGGERPKVAGNLETAAFAMARPDAGGGAGGGAKGQPAAGGGGQAGDRPQAAGAGWSDAPISAAGLRAVDVDVALSAGDLRLAGLHLSDLRSRLNVDAGRAVLEIARAGAYGGTVTGQVVVNARKGLSVGGTLGFAGIALQPMLADVAGYDRLSATGDLTLDFVAGGKSVAALLRGLDGKGRLALGAGEIRGIDIPALLATLDASGVGPQEKTVFDALTASFRIENGDLFNEDLKLQSPYVRATGSGRVGLGARDIDYRLRATALQGADGTDRITLPVLIDGPWADPRVTLDLEAIAKERLGGKAAAVEDELRRRADEKLGRKKGERLQDAARRKVQEELDKQAADALDSLLGGN